MVYGKTWHNRRGGYYPPEARETELFVEWRWLWRFATGRLLVDPYSPYGKLLSLTLPLNLIILRADAIRPYNKQKY